MVYPELDTDGVPRGQLVLDDLVALLDLEQLEENLFRGVSPAISPVRVFGGQVAAQALVAMGRTVPSDRRVHSLHGYFIRPGDPRVPIVYTADRSRDGRSFTTRRVVAIQHGQPIFTMSGSFQVDEPGIDHATPMPLAIPDPETLPTYAERLAPLRDTFRARMVFADSPRAFDVRYVTEPSWASRPEVPDPTARTQVWFKADGELPDDDLLHVCLLAYLSDLILLDGVLVKHGMSPFAERVQMASLDHAMWFHRPIRVDQWMLYDITSPSASGARGLGTGSFFAADGRLLATVVQEGLIRLR